MKSQKSNKSLKRITKQLLGVSLVWLVGIALIGWSLSEVPQVSQLTQLKFMPVYLIILLSAIGLGWYFYTYTKLKNNV